MTEDNDKKTNEQKINFFRRMVMSVKDFDKYHIFATENFGVATRYFFKIILLFTLIVAALFTYQFTTSVEKGIQYFKDTIHEISYEDGNLMVNQGEKIDLKQTDSILSYLVIDTDATQEEIQEYQNQLNTFDNGLLLLKDKLIYRNTMLSQNVEYTYSDIATAYSINHFDKQNVLDFIQSIDKIALYSGFYFIIFVYLFLIYSISTIMDVIMLAILGFIIARIAGMKLRFKATCNIGIYALTLPIILNLVYIIVNTFTGFTIQYFSWMYTTISYIYVIVAVLMIKTDLMNQQAELMKIIEEQEKVKQELLKREQEKQEEEKNSPKEKQNKEENGTKQEEKQEDKANKKKQKDNNLGEDGLALGEIKNLPNQE